VAGVSDQQPNRRARRIAAATSPAPAVAAAVERAAVEREGDAPIDGSAPAEAAQALAAGDLPAVQPEAIAAVDAAVVPEPTLVAQPDAPAPIVTASPPLTGEPDALDVVQAKAAAHVDVDSDGSVPDREAPHATAAGQPMLTIERGGFPAFASHEGHATITSSSTTASLSAATLLTGTRDLSAGRMPSEARARVKVIEVVGPRQGRRRAGFAFGPEPRRFLGTQLTDAQLDAIRADRMLTVGISEIDADDALFPDG
jgi:hypothetical protein